MAEADDLAVFPTHTPTFPPEENPSVCRRTLGICGMLHPYSCRSVSALHHEPMNHAACKLAGFKTPSESYNSTN